ncbi:hypothetical protein AVEN_69760-1 [Araneus ventricosus]|uniref:Uncharacterized protein n=1 Tax=Araneus ventricosus TaxID=182803 RepID=A0A4Y2CXT7_ARAVE|nr:hypothetical protein AVEN_69760-1 [Araneus ventricosus]
MISRLGSDECQVVIRWIIKRAISTNFVSKTVQRNLGNKKSLESFSGQEFDLLSLPEKYPKIFLLCNRYVVFKDEDYSAVMSEFETSVEPAQTVTRMAKTETSPTGILLEESHAAATTFLDPKLPEEH